MSEDDVLSRRDYLAVLGTAATGTVAGCPDPRSQSFEARPVGLSTAVQETYRVTETVQEPVTERREGPGGVEVSITNHAAVYSRTVGRGGQ
jgi:hypothetical protein